VEIYKQLEWCLEHGYTRFEMGVGGMDYKRRWSNSIYQFQHWILISNKNTVAKCFGFAAYWTVLLKEYLKSKKLNDIRDAIRSKISRGKLAGPEPGNFSIVPLQGPMDPTQWTEMV